jgi:signal transduction histidine kinase
VLLNLLENAIRFSDVGAPVRITSEIEGQQVLVKVIDRGPGIPSDARAEVFDRPVKGGDSLREISGRTGLGLYLSARIVEAHGGQIGVQSEIGEGSTFFFSLPFTSGSLSSQ